MIVAGCAVRSVWQEPIDVIERHPELSIQNNIEPSEATRRDSHDRIGTARKAHGFTDKVRIGAKAAMPQAIADHHRWNMFFFGCKATADFHPQSCDIEKVSSDSLSPNALRLARAVNRSRQQIVICRDARKRFRLFAKVFIKRPTEVVAALVLTLRCMYRHE